MSDQLPSSEREVSQSNTSGAGVARLRALKDLHVLDVGTSSRFNRIMLLSTVLFDVPMAAISLIDGDHQWITARQGFDIDEIRREDSFCNVTIDSSEIFTVESASKDPRFAANPLVVGYPHVEFYAGFPIETQGQRVGSLCIMDSRPRVLTPDQEVSLQGFALVVQTELERIQERERAAEVHRALLPPPLTTLPGYQVAGVCVPTWAVGGDYFDWTVLDSGKLVVSVADVMGKGVSAAVIMASIRAAFKTLELRSSLAQIVSDVAHALEDDLNRTGTFVTLFHALIDPATGAVEYVDAGHGLAMVLHSDGSHDRLPVRGIPLGVDAQNEWTSGYTTLQPGDTLLVVSDGLWEMLGGDVQARDEIVARIIERDDLVEALNSVLNETSLREAHDDITALAVRREVG